MTVLIVTHSGDNPAPGRVAAAVRARDGTVIRLDSDRFPAAVGAAVDPTRGSGTLRLPSGTLSLDAIKATWVRRLAVGHGLSVAGLGLAERAACIGESRAALRAMLDGLVSPMLGRPWAVERARDKLWQLRVASGLGLDVPATRVTNDPSAVRALAARHSGGLVAKMLHSFSLPTPDGPRVVHTHRLGPADLDDLGGLAASPMVFQQAITAVRELRAVVVGERVMVAGLPREDRAPVDWRRDARRLMTRWGPATLPGPTVHRLIALCQALGLAHASVDMLEDADGRLWFLELNPAGEWLWLEEIAGLDVSGALADALLSGVGDPG
ncbi:MAG: MvdD family ATP-grasp ribosomal peptide maturase [Myxococcota bacterium]|nr:MvdD family ATP-grasp ribosomal peptide maturase [Myxococcota bacterium]